MNPRERLGERIGAWRRMRGFRTQKSFAAAAGLAARTVGSLERGELTQHRADTYDAVERTLGWSPGSIDAVLRGGEPEAVGRPLDKDLQAINAVWGQLPESTKRIIRVIIDEENRDSGASG